MSKSGTENTFQSFKQYFLRPVLYVLKLCIFGLYFRKAAVVLYANVFPVTSMKNTYRSITVTDWLRYLRSASHSNFLYKVLAQLCLFVVFAIVYFNTAMAPSSRNAWSIGPQKTFAAKVWVGFVFLVWTTLTFAVLSMNQLFFETIAFLSSHFDKARGDPQRPTDEHTLDTCTRNATWWSLGFETVSIVLFTIFITIRMPYVVQTMLANGLCGYEDNRLQYDNSGAKLVYLLEQSPQTTSPLQNQQGVVGTDQDTHHQYQAVQSAYWFLLMFSFQALLFTIPVLYPKIATKGPLTVLRFSLEVLFGFLIMTIIGVFSEMFLFTYHLSEHLLRLSNSQKIVFTLSFLSVVTGAYLGMFFLSHLRFRGYKIGRLMGAILGTIAAFLCVILVIPLFIILIVLPLVQLSRPKNASSTFNVLEKMNTISRDNLKYLWEGVKSILFLPFYLFQTIARLCSSIRELAEKLRQLRNLDRSAIMSTLTKNSTDLILVFLFWCLYGVLKFSLLRAFLCTDHKTGGAQETSNATSNSITSFDEIVERL